MQVNIVQENNISYTKFYKSIEIFWFIHHYITCCGLVASPHVYLLSHESEAEAFSFQVKHKWFLGTLASLKSIDFVYCLKTTKLKTAEAWAWSQFVPMFYLLALATGLKVSLSTFIFIKACGTDGNCRKKSAFPWEKYHKNLPVDPSLYLPVHD